MTSAIVFMAGSTRMQEPSSRTIVEACPINETILNAGQTNSSVPKLTVSPRFYGSAEICGISASPTMAQ